jgi:2-hydroxy-6-oxonona-2,4-dienedioate hydrolase
VVLVHGLVVSSRYMVPIAERLAPYYRVYAPDLPGFGKSAKPPRALDIPELADSLDAWMQAIGLESAVLIGNSIGCQVIAHLAVRHPERVERTVLQGPTMDPRGRTVLRQVGRFLTNSTREPLSLAPVMMLDYLAAGFGRAWRTFQYALWDRIEDNLPHLRVPTLVVRGSRDPIVPKRWAEEASRLLPDGRLVVVPNATHTVNFEAPSEFAHVIRAFLNERQRWENERGP